MFAGGGVVAAGVVDAVGVEDAVGVLDGRGSPLALLPAAPVPGVGAFTVADGPPVLSPPPHAQRMAVTPKHIAIRDLMSASNIGSLSKQNASCPVTT
jgi:hypothetical protein